MKKCLTSEDVKVAAMRLGFDIVGITNVEPFPRFLKEVKRRRANGTITDEMANLYPPMGKVELFSDPKASMPLARSIIVLGMRYLIDERHESGTPSDPRGRISKDYWRHFYAEIDKRRQLVINFLRENGAEVLDENLVPTKAAVHRSGVGTYGKNTVIQNEDHGSWMLFRAISTDLELRPDEEAEPRCGSCQRCIRLCPTKAIVEPYVVDASRCLTDILAMPGPIPLELREMVGDRINSCGHCQEVCPRNDNVQPIKTELDDPFGPWTKSPRLLDLVNLTREEFDRHFHDMEWNVDDHRLLIRNALVALGNVGDVSVVPAIQRFIDGDDVMLAEHAAWAKDNILRRKEVEE
ncbi:MAG: Epoxyqueuosine reductase [Methanomassiliicoccales archaeon PtaU1.Bin124]|nr:MAG: Epoxyqueuosine reductase [Methanomassiliicoccales archaeon PtaU1.Bin124]